MENKKNDKDKIHDPVPRHHKLRTQVIKDKTKYSRKEKHKNHGN